MQELTRLFPPFLSRPRQGSRRIHGLPNFRGLRVGNRPPPAKFSGPSGTLETEGFYVAGARSMLERPAPLRGG
jgi:hypothetical protein